MNPIDTYIGKQMKRYAARHRPPTNGRKRLLITASTIPGALNNKLLRERQPIFWTCTYDYGQNSNWSILSFDRSFIYSLGVLNLRHVL